jgi:hypothetical protein
MIDCSWRNIPISLIDLAALGVEWRRESYLRVVADSGAQLHTHARKMVAGTAHSDWVHSRHSLVDHEGYQPKTALTGEKSPLHSKPINKRYGLVTPTIVSQR